MKDLNLSLKYCFTIAGFLILALFLVAQQFNKPILAVIDTQALVAIEAQKMAESYPNGKVQPEKIQSIADGLKRKVDRFAKEHQLVLLAKGAVWGGELKDYTEQMIEIMKAE